MRRPSLELGALIQRLLKVAGQEQHQQSENREAARSNWQQRREDSASRKFRLPHQIAQWLVPFGCERKRRLICRVRWPTRKARTVDQVARLQFLERAAI